MNKTSRLGHSIHHLRLTLSETKQVEVLRFGKSKKLKVKSDSGAVILSEAKDLKLLCFSEK